MENLTRSTFEECDTKEYRIELDGGQGPGSLTLELSECAALPSAREGDREPFSLLFRGPAEPVLPQRIYRLDNDELGTLEIFLVPVASDDEATEYEAVFN